MKKSESERSPHVDDKLPLPSRRNVLRGALAAGAVAGSGLWTPTRSSAQAITGSTPGTVASYVPVLDAPAAIRLYLEDDEHGTALARSDNAWHGSGCTVTAQRTDKSGPQPSSVQLQLQAPSKSVERVHLRWSQPLPAEKIRVLGDAWERSYGDLAWREVIPERPLPWYALAFDGERTHGYGVATGAACFAFWQLDAEGISLWLDVRNGGRGVLLAGRTLSMATVLTREGKSGETPLDATYALCRLMCLNPRPFSGPIYGSNDWYYAYGNSSAEDIVRDADLVASLAPSRGPRPFTVADDGWTNRSRFPDMPRLAEEVRKRGVRPGIWIRPLVAPSSAKASLLLPATRFASPAEAADNQAYDPTIQEGLELALDKVHEVKGWGFELIKHDFSTYDLLGQWGSAMQASPCRPGWSFNDRSRTTAEIILHFYQSIRQAAGDAVVIGCNTVGQLSAGIFEGQRIGDDVSGKVWERTRRMGVNTLGFRIAQQGAYFCADPDCIPVTNQIDWSLTEQWLRVVAQSGTALVISPERGSFGPEQQTAVREAFALAASGGTGARPQDWLQSLTPSQWKGAHGSSNLTYEWLQPGGAYPFSV